MQNSIQSKIDKIRGQGNQVDLGSVLPDILGAVTATPTTTADLKAMRDNGELVAGAWYRITDYQCTTTQEDTKSAGHVFDILVLALDGKTLSEEARAIQHEGDTYFADCNLAAWKIWYCIDNDVRRFMWADEENGHGVIYRMIDEWGNDVPYDFKNVQFVRTLTDGAYDPDGEDVYVYTFNWYDENGECKDASIVGNDGTLLNDEQIVAGVFGNVIKPSYDNYGQDEQETKSNKQEMNNIVFLSDYGSEGGIYYGCYSNTFGNDCYSNTFGNYCNSNTFGNYCYSNTFGNDCYSNTFGNSNKNNELDGYITRCNVGNSCQYILIPSGTDSQNKQFGVVFNGTSGTSISNKLTINFESGKNYPQFAAKKSDGSLDIWHR